jgi:uncharacterized glyoxalase superfamily protein PhnB
MCEHGVGEAAARPAPVVEAPQAPGNEDTIMPTLKQLIPVLMYRDIQGAHDFLVNAFGFDGGAVHRNADGQAVHGEVRAGNSTIWLHHVLADHGLDSPAAGDVANSGLFLYVDDVDMHYARARAMGALIDSPPVDQPYGQREYGARDPEGHRWWFGARIAAPTKD